MSDNVFILLTQHHVGGEAQEARQQLTSGVVSFSQLAWYHVLGPMNTTYTEEVRYSNPFIFHLKVWTDKVSFRQKGPSKQAEVKRMVGKGRSGSEFQRRIMGKKKGPTKRQNMEVKRSLDYSSPWQRRSSFYGTSCFKMFPRYKFLLKLGWTSRAGQQLRPFNWHLSECVVPHHRAAVLITRLMRMMFSRSFFRLIWLTLEALRILPEAFTWQSVMRSRPCVFVRTSLHFQV